MQSSINVGVFCNIGSTTQKQNQKKSAELIEIVVMAPEYTHCTLKNFSGRVLKLHSLTIWDGLSATPQPEIANQSEDQFKHMADGGSVGGLLYELGDEGNKFKLIIAWKNARDEDNKVLINLYYCM